MRVERGEQSTIQLLRCEGEERMEVEGGENW